MTKDTGFDPLISYLRENKIWALREKDLAEIPLLQISNAASTDERIDAIVKSLVTRGTSRPRKTKTLGNSINSLFQKTLEEKEVSRIIEELKKRKLITIDQDNVSYKLPESITE